MRLKHVACMRLGLLHLRPYMYKDKFRTKPLHTCSSQYIHCHHKNANKSLPFKRRRTPDSARQCCTTVRHIFHMHASVCGRARSRTRFEDDWATVHTDTGVERMPIHRATRAHALAWAVKIIFSLWPSRYGRRRMDMKDWRREGMRGDGNSADSSNNNNGSRAAVAGSHHTVKNDSPN